jgi:hypothetical protein
MAKTQDRDIPEASPGTVYPAIRLAAAVICQALVDLSDGDLRRQLDAAAWLLDEQSSAPIMFDAAGLDAPRAMLRQANFRQMRPGKPRKGTQTHD